jgi:hypothetical protein
VQRGYRGQRQAGEACSALYVVSRYMGTIHGTHRMTATRLQPDNVQIPLQIVGIFNVIQVDRFGEL